MNSRRFLGLLTWLAAPLVPLLALADEPLPKIQLTATEIASLAAGKPATGVQMTPLVGDSSKPGLYTVRVAIPANTQVPPHTHRDNRTVSVVSGTWSMAYGNAFDAKTLKALAPGSVYTEPAGQAHFSQTGDQPVVILVTGYGPSDTQFVKN
jgi:quercetin dioxygenase-like cupin family protein